MSSVSIYGIVKNQKPRFRSWFDTSPRTEIQSLTVDWKRSPWGIEGWTRIFARPSTLMNS